ncbi:hypothetical protein HDU93_004132, partial [Gonapodya sp. JEL0774]
MASRGGSGKSFDIGEYEENILKLIKTDGIVSFESLADMCPEFSWSGNQKVVRQALDEFVVKIITLDEFRYHSDQEKDMLAKMLLRTMFKGGHYDHADLAHHHPSNMNVLMDPWEFDPHRRNTQLQAYFEYVFKTVPLQKTLRDDHEKLVRFTLTQLQQGVTHHGVRGADIGYTSEAVFASKWEDELHPLQTIVNLWYVADPFKSEETTTMFTGLFLELLTKQIPWKNVYRNQKPPRGNKDDRPDKTWTASSHSVLEFEAKSPNNALFPMDVMKGACSCAHSVKGRRKVIGKRKHGEEQIESLLALGKGPVLYAYTTVEPYGVSGVAVTMPICDPCTIPTERNAPAEKVVEFVGYISALCERAHISGELFVMTMGNTQKDIKGKGKAVQREPLTIDDSGASSATGPAPAKVDGPRTPRYVGSKSHQFQSRNLSPPGKLKLKCKSSHYSSKFQ